jgi:hypothetical protein
LAPHAADRLLAAGFGSGEGALALKPGGLMPIDAGSGLRYRSGIRRWRWSDHRAERTASMFSRRLKSIAGRRLVVGALTSTVVFATASAPAAADPAHVPVIGGNCHGLAVATYASADPEGVGRYVENVRQFQQDVDDFLCP